MKTAVEWLYNNLKSHFEHDGDLLEVVQFSFEQAKEMEKQRERAIFSIAYRMTPIEFGKEYCESEFEKFNKTFKQQEQ